MADITTTYQLNFTGDQINSLLTRTNNLDTELNNYLLKNGGDMNGAINMNGQNISGLGEPTEDSHAVPKFYADNIAQIANSAKNAADSAKNTADSALPKSGGIMTGGIAMGGNKVTGLGAPADDGDAVNKAYVDAIRTLAQEGKTLAENALPKSGGTMTGAIAMGGSKVTGLGTPVEAGDAASKSYVDGKHVVKTATITTTWKGSAAPYTQSVTVSGILSTDYPHITPVYSTTNSTAIAQKKAWANVSKAVAESGKITFTCFEEKPTTAIPIQIEVMR